MKKVFLCFFVMIFVFSMFFNFPLNIVFASPEKTLIDITEAEQLLIKLQNSENFDENSSEDFEKIYKELDLIFHENTQFYSYHIEKLEKVMDEYRNYIINSARNMASNKEYKQATQFLESKSELFKDKSTINSLISNYSKFFVKDGLFYYEKTPKFLSVNKLVAYSQLAFCEENLKSDNIDKLYLTSKEFQNLLNELYLNDYVLINLFDFIEISDGIVSKKDLYLPLNKTPVVLFMNNVNYFENENWFIEKFILDGKDEIACYNSKQTEKNQLSYSTDFIPILEKFVQNHSDFSLNNARSVITFDKNGAILGYNINKTNPNCGQDINSLKKIVSKLKQLGYVFGYGNFDESFKNLQIESEIEFISQNLLPIFGTINVYFSPFEKNKNNKFYNELENLGFKIFVDFNSNNFLIKNNQAFLSSTNICGEFLREDNGFLGIDFEKIYEHNARTKLF